MRILLVEDNPDLAAHIAEFLESRDQIVEIARDGSTGLHLAVSKRFDVILLDLGLPHIDGSQWCSHIRHSAPSAVPIIALTARDTEANILQGFEAGADDYVTKPFALLELWARILAAVRRSARAREVLRTDDLSFDLRTLTIQRGMRTITLPPIGMRILEQLMRAAPGVVTRQQIESTVWGDGPPGTSAALRGHILIIRNAIDADGEPKLLHTVHSIGYRLG